MIHLSLFRNKTSAGESQTTYTFSNNINSATLTVNPNGDPVANIRYLPFGEERWNEVDLPTDRGYTGQRNEAGFGLQDYNARYYSAYLGRFVSPDSIIPDPTNSMDWDRYQYARSNAIKYNDPSGHDPSLILDGVFILYDLYQITQEGWTPVNTVALVADIACAIVPIPSGGGSAAREFLSGKDAVLAFSKSAVILPSGFKIG